jgi:hypothetical protein
MLLSSGPHIMQPLWCYSGRKVFNPVLTITLNIASLFALLMNLLFIHF